YEHADSKLRHPAIKMNLGALLVRNNRASDAIKPLMDAINHPQMAAGAYQGLGQAYLALDKPRQSVKYLLQCLQMVDSSQALLAEESDELNSIYEQLSQVVETVS